MELDGKAFALGSVIGLILMAASLIAYIVEPGNPLIVLFVIGLVLLVVGYVMTYRENHRIFAEYESAQKCEDLEGYVISFDEDYVPFENPATIEDLRG